MKAKNWKLNVALMAMALLSATAAMAHGEAKPMYGGVVQMANDVGFELVTDTDGATIYLMDHGKPMSAKGISGKLTILQGGNKTEVEIKEAGDNRLRATGVKLGKGDRVVAVLNNVAGKSTTVRFALK